MAKTFNLEEVSSWLFAKRGCVEFVTETVAKEKRGLNPEQPHANLMSLP